ncbi:uncharacterized protein LOC116338608 [Contarinia nasturtii]|uniref:uncharacterized protein LOC116338608 n=1 Tax=Contarinia nasturtii TaxID=265458 RepID=UPI0012D4246F|nr:uncharacterized protein LOC116338608 [Contarinia nasturtii]XP_031619857.1 uncharacterized protein LOC116338608 [Contarinia nasturtii]
MRIFQMLCAISRRPQNPYKVPLAKPRLPFRLKDKIRGKGAKLEMNQTVQQMQNLITKLAQNDYDQRFCADEIKLMNESARNSFQEYVKQKKENRAEHVKPGKDVNAIQVNKYLKKFPTLPPNPYEAKLKKHSELPSNRQKFIEE